MEEHERKKIFGGWYYILDKVLEKIKDILGIEKYDETKILIDTGNKLPDTLKNVVILMTCVIKDGKFYPQLFLEEALTLPAPNPDKEKKSTKILIFTLLCGVSKSFLKALKAFIKPFEAPQRSVKIKI